VSNGAWTAGILLLSGMFPSREGGLTRMDGHAPGLDQELDGIKLKASSLRDQALRVTRARIISGKLRPGMLYTLGSTAEQLGVSVTPVREAVLDLAKDGLVELERNRGFRVREMTQRDLDEIVELRRMIEVPAVRTIAERMLVTDSDQLRQLAMITEKCAAAGDWVGFLNNDREFHLGLLAYLGNERLLVIAGSLRDQSRLYGLDRLTGTESLMKSTREHYVLLEAVTAGHADEAAAIMERHLRHARGIWAGLVEQASEREPALGASPGSGRA
jgi:DNA-binding GntR family transcriptional regulator